jgi:hypothetical protein
MELVAIYTEVVVLVALLLTMGLVLLAVLVLVEL